MEIRQVNEIPNRERKFGLSEQTKALVKELTELTEGNILAFDEPNEKLFKGLYSKLKTAIRKADGSYTLALRKGTYYVQKHKQVTGEQVSLNTEFDNE